MPVVGGRVALLVLVAEREWPFCGSWPGLFIQGEDGIRYDLVTGVQPCALPISGPPDLHQSGWRVPPEQPADSSIKSCALRNRSFADSCGRSHIDAGPVGPKHHHEWAIQNGAAVLAVSCQLSFPRVSSAWAKALSYGIVR